VQLKRSNIDSVKTTVKTTNIYIKLKTKLNLFLNRIFIIVVRV